MKIKIHSSPSPEEQRFSEVSERAVKPVVLHPMRYNFDEHGVTQSLLSKWRECPTKARRYLQGYHRPTVSISLSFGNHFHHLCEHFYTKVRDGGLRYGDLSVVDMNQWVEETLRKDFFGDFSTGSHQEREIFETSIGFCKTVFPAYVEHWKSDFEGEKEKRWVALEKSFRMDLTGMKGNFIGKRDADYRDKGGKLWLFETKTKARWNELFLGMTISRNLQVNAYELAMESDYKEKPVGVLYNIIRRPQLKQKVTEFESDYFNRIAKDVTERPDFYFLRLEVPILWDQVEEFRGRFMQEIKEFSTWSKQDPKLDRQCDSQCDGVYGPCEFLQLCHSGGKDFTGLSVRKKMFSELPEEEFD